MRKFLFSLSLICIIGILGLFLVGTVLTSPRLKVIGNPPVDFPAEPVELHLVIVNLESV